MPYGTLRADCVVETADRLALRIGARFPSSGLEAVCRALADAARRCAQEAERLRRPQRILRTGVYAVWIVGAAAFVWVLRTLHYEHVSLEASQLIPLLEPAMNIAVLVGLGVLSLGRLELNWKRARALDYLHELRSIAHVVDMHQLTKDPARSAPGAIAPTAHSPKDPLPPALLERYLDYCTEMLSLTGKLAALLAQSCRDATVSDAASDVEALTTGLSQKIWQKLTLLERLSA